MFTLNTWVTNIDINNVISTDLDSIKQAKRFYEINSLRNCIVQELNSKYGDYHILYTDGSKSDEISGAAFHDSGSNNILFKITSNVCIMSVELFAISEALAYVEASRYKKVVIFTDSKSALQHLARCASGLRGVPVAYAILARINNVLESFVELRLQWIPSHIGLRGNEKADLLAKTACLEGSEVFVMPNYAEVTVKYKSIIYDMWKEYFDRRSKEKGIWYRTIQSQPPRKPWFEVGKLNRSMIKIAHRLRSGHVPSNKFLFLMRKSDSPNCDVCGVVEDVHHLLIECARDDQGRRTLIRDLKLNLSDIGVFHTILSSPTSGEAKMIYDFYRSSYL
uniref:Non-LTR retrotransposon CATS n=1 Tax=Pararge aegeria TaxID=116150 RepID=S4PIJ9_9NEOP